MKACDQAGIMYRTPRLGSTTNYHKFCMFVDSQSSVIKKFAEKDISVDKQYQENFEYSLLANSLAQKDYMPGTNYYNKHVITLPTDPYITKDELEQICNILVKC